MGPDRRCFADRRMSSTLWQASVVETPTDYLRLRRGSMIPPLPSAMPSVLDDTSRLDRKPEVAAIELRRVAMGVDLRLGRVA